MKTFLLRLFVLLCLVLTLPLVAEAEEDAQGLEAEDPETEYRYDLLRGTSFAREAVEWSLIAGMVVVDKAVLGEMEPWPDEPVLSTNYKYWSPGESRDSTVSSKWLYISGSVLGAAVLLLPNRKGWLNHSSYRHFKGFIESTLAITPVLTSLAKLSFGKERPYYDQVRNEGAPIEANDRQSFWSGHASAVFSFATYFNLFLINNIGDNSQKYTFLWKGAITLSTYSLATFVAATRVSDHRHDALDVTVGAAVGSAVSLLIYGLHENWFGNFYEDEKGESVTEGKRPKQDVFVSAFPGGFSLIKTF